MTKATVTVSLGIKSRSDHGLDISSPSPPKLHIRRCIGEAQGSTHAPPTQSFGLPSPPARTLSLCGSPLPTIRDRQEP